MSKSCHANPRQTLVTTGDLSKCPFAQVDNATGVSRAVVVDLHDYATTCILIDHSHTASKWQATVRGCHAPAIEAFTVGGEPSIETMPVVTGSAATTRGMGWNCQGSED